MLKYFRLSFLSVLLVFVSTGMLGAAAAGPTATATPIGGCGGTFQVQTFNLSTSVLMDMYNQSKNSGGSSVNVNNVFINPNVITMLVLNSSGGAAVFGFGFKIFDYDYSSSNVIASATGFMTNSPLPAGASTINLSSVNTSLNINGFFDQNYADQQKSKYGSGNDMNFDKVQNAISQIQAKPYYIVVTDCNGNSISQPFRLLLFAPQSSTASPATLLNPLNGLPTGVTPNFSWTPVTGAGYYILTIGEDASLSNPVFQSGQLFATSNLYSPGNRALEAGKTYFWQVQSFNSSNTPIGGTDGKSVIGEFSVSKLGVAEGSGVNATDLADLAKVAAPAGVFDSVNGYVLLGVSVDGVQVGPDVLQSLIASLNNHSASINSAQAINHW